MINTTPSHQCNCFVWGLSWAIETNKQSTWQTEEKRKINSNWALIQMLTLVGIIGFGVKSSLFLVFGFFVLLSKWSPQRTPMIAKIQVMWKAKEKKIKKRKENKNQIEKKAKKSMPFGSPFQGSGGSIWLCTFDDIQASADYFWCCQVKELLYIVN